MPLFAHRLLRALAVVVAATAAVPASAQASALDLYGAWQQAFAFDPHYRAAISEFGASQAQKNISRAGLLPQISGAYSKRHISGWRERPGFMGIISRSDLSYDSKNLHLQLRQPLLNYPKWAEYQRGKAVAQQGVAQLHIAQQQNSLQVAQNYFNVILAYVDHEEQQRRVDFLAHRVRTFVQLERQNEATRVELADTQARLATAAAEQLQAYDALRNAVRELQAQIGFKPSAIHSINTENLPAPLTTPLKQLQAYAREHNREVKAAQQQVAIGRARLENARSQYFPSLDLVATAGRGDSEDLTTLSQRTNTFTIGVQLQVPIFTGGYTTAISSQARFGVQQAEHLYQYALVGVETQVAKLYSQYHSGIELVKAQKTAYESSQRSVESALISFEAGAISNLDVLEAQDQLSETRYQYYQAQLELVQTQLELAVIVGESLHQPIQDISAARFESKGSAILKLADSL